MGKKINQQFLILQVIGISLVVIGHKGGISLFEEWFPAYSFHMPLFVFISGYFYKSESDKNIIKFILNKVKNLIIPYFIWNIIYGLIVFILKRKEIILFGDDFNLTNIFIDPWISGHQFLFNLASWFVLALFLVQINYVIFRFISRKVHLKNEYIIMFILMIIGYLGVIQANLGYINRDSLTIVRAMFLLPFYHMGYLYKEKLEEKDNLNSWIYFLIIFTIQFLLIKKYKVIAFSVVWCNDFNRSNILLPYITSITGIMFWLRVSRILMPSLKDNKVINYIGKNTWTVMMHHMFIFFLINLTFSVISPIVGLESFDYNNFRQNIYYSYSPEVGHFRFFYVIAGIFVPLGVKYYLERLIIKIRNN